MMASDNLQPANDNALSRDAALSLRLLHWFLESREDAIAGLIGTGYRPDALRDQLMRLICLNFAEGCLWRLPDYQKDLGARWTQSAVAMAVTALDAADLIAIDVNGPSTGLIRPTRRLISFYNKNMPEVFELAKKILYEVSPADAENRQ